MPIRFVVYVELMAFIARTCHYLLRHAMPLRDKRMLYFCYYAAIVAFAFTRHATLLLGYTLMRARYAAAPRVPFTL